MKTMLLLLALVPSIALAQAPPSDTKVRLLTLEHRATLQRMKVDRDLAAYWCRRLNQATLDRIAERECQEKVQQAIEAVRAEFSS